MRWKPAWIGPSSLRLRDEPVNQFLSDIERGAKPRQRVLILEGTPHCRFPELLTPVPFEREHSSLARAGGLFESDET